ncbi:hypothetical protein DK37_14225 [Halomonas sp. SUBG004]|nr:hypothetical protein DK37_14225 [Halomonas sp. SUBG004]
MGPFKLGRGFKTWPSGAVGYVVTPAGAAKLLAATTAIQCVLDDWPYFETKGVKVQEVRPLLVWEDFIKLDSSLEGERQTPARRKLFSIARSGLRRWFVQFSFKSLKKDRRFMTLRRSLERLLPFITAAVPGGFSYFLCWGIAGFFLAPDSMVFFFYSVHPGGLFSSWCQGLVLRRS